MDINMINFLKHIYEMLINPFNPYNKEPKVAYRN